MRLKDRCLRVLETRGEYYIMLEVPSSIYNWMNKDGSIAIVMRPLALMLYNSASNDK